MDDGITVLTRLAHRSAYIDPTLGDGIGIHTALPHDFFARVVIEVLLS